MCVLDSMVPEVDKFYVSKFPIKLSLTWTTSNPSALHQFAALIVPPNNGEAKWKYQTITVSMDGIVTFQRPQIFLDSGWVYAVGNSPIVATERITAAADGSQLVVWAEKVGFVWKDRVVKLAGQKVKDGKNATSQWEIETDRHFIEFINATPQDVPKCIDQGGPSTVGESLKLFIDGAIVDGSVATGTQSPMPKIDDNCGV